jgi:hypothetical protein
VTPQACIDGSCATDPSRTESEAGDYPFVYAIGSIAVRFPSLGVEKEFVQATGRRDTAGLTDQQALQSVLSESQNRYLSRQVCWVLSIEGLDTYILQPREAADYDQLLEAVRTNPEAEDVDVVIGLRGPLAPPSMCNGLTVPLVAFSQIYSFDRASFFEAVPIPDRKDAEQFRNAVRSTFNSFLRVADNAGATDEHRALNYLATRYPAVYERASAQLDRNFYLTAVETTGSRLSGVRRLVNVILVFTHRQTQEVERYSVRVDVTEEFPFLASPLMLAPYMEH